MLVKVKNKLFSVQQAETRKNKTDLYTEKSATARS
jgi:hypothetical protein